MLNNTWLQGWFVYQDKTCKRNSSKLEAARVRSRETSDRNVEPPEVQLSLCRLNSSMRSSRNPLSEQSHQTKKSS